MFLNYLLLFLLTIIFLEIFFILIQTVKNKFSCHVLSENAILIAPNSASYCGVRCKSAADERRSAVFVLFGIVVLFGLNRYFVISPYVSIHLSKVLFIEIKECRKRELCIILRKLITLYVNGMRSGHIS